jgi:hypothetical protein
LASFKLLLVCWGWSGAFLAQAFAPPASPRGVVFGNVYFLSNAVRLCLSCAKKKKKKTSSLLDEMSKKVVECAQG